MAATRVFSILPTLAVSLLALIVHSGCGRNEAADPHETTMKTISSDLAPVRDFFARTQGQPRFVALLSPT